MTDERSCRAADSETVAQTPGPINEDTLTRVAGIVDRARERNLDRARELADWVAVAQRSHDGLDPADRAVAREVAHQLAGSAGTFGYHEATDLAREIEELFTGAEDTQGWSRAGACVRRLSEQLRHPPNDPATVTD